MFQYPISLPGQPVSGLNISSFWCRTVLHTPSAPQHVLCSISQNSPLFTRCFGHIFYFLWSLWLKAPQSNVFVSPTASEWNLTAANSPSSNTRAPDRLLLQYGCASHFSNLTRYKQLIITHENAFAFSFLICVRDVTFRVVQMEGGAIKKKLLSAFVRAIRLVIITLSGCLTCGSIVLCGRHR